MSVQGAIKKAKLERNREIILERGKKKMQAKALRQARKLKENKNANA